MEEAVRLLQQEQYDAQSYYLQLSQLPAKLFHVLMTLSTTGARLYTAGGEFVRQSIFANMLGKMMWTESVIQAGLRQQDKHQTQRHIGVVVQEMVIGATPTDVLQKMFDHIFLLVPDVQPKQNAVGMMQKHCAIVTPVVWNVSAQKALEKQGLSPLLVQPQMVQAFAPLGWQLPSTHNETLVKTSGSGMPPHQILEVLSALREQEAPYEFHHPQFIATQQGVFPTMPYASWRRVAYMKKFFECLPTRLISLPSEQLRIALELMMLGWGGRWGALEPRGPHEHINLREVESWGVQKVAQGWYKPKEELSRQLGKTPFVQAMLARLHEL